MNVSAVDKVLLVDDDKVTNLMHTRMMRQAGLAKVIDIATDGEAAIEYLQTEHARGEQPPQIIFLDLNMPRMNGFEFLEEYKRLPPDAKTGQKIIMLSTSVLHEDHKRAEADPDVTAFVIKPIRKQNLQSIFDIYHS